MKEVVNPNFLNLPKHKKKFDSRNILVLFLNSCFCSKVAR